MTTPTPSDTPADPPPDPVDPPPPDPTATTEPGPESDNGSGVAALVLGIVAVVAAANGWWLFLLPVAIATGVLAVVFGVRGRRAAAAGRAANPGQSLAGLVLGTTALSLVALGGAAWAIWGDDWKDDDDTFDECIDDADDAEELGTCLDRFPDDAENLLQ